MPLRVLISGAGIAGPTLAWVLAKTGARITIIEKSKCPLPYGQNIDITGSALKVIKKMGLLSEVRRYNTTEKGTQFIDSKGRPFAPLPVKEGSQASFTSEFEILRGDLALVLYEATKNQSNIEYIFGTTIKNIISNDDNSVKVELGNGESQEYDLLVAADGQWSKVRKQCFPPEDVTVVDQGMYVAYFTIPRIPSDNNWWNVYLALQSRVITLRPDPHGTIRAMFTLMPRSPTQKAAWQNASKSDRQTQQDLAIKEFSNAGWQAQRLLSSMDQAPDFYFQAVQQIRMSKWSTSRVICLGDAAFAPTPLTGMGTSLAITSAYVLGGELSKLQEGEHPAKAFEAYEKIFRPFVEEIQEIPGFVPGIAHPEGALKRWLVHLLVRTLSRISRISWLMNRIGQENEEDFILPKYPRLGDEDVDVDVVKDSVSSDTGHRVSANSMP